jgi:REP element-mobilizing transposase RayT
MGSIQIMREENRILNRRSIRLKEYDYSQAGAYFVTICTNNRECLFGEIMGGKMVLNKLGEIVEEEWEISSRIRSEIELHSFVIMPNHIHGIMVIRDHRSVGATGRSPLHAFHRTLPPKSLGAFVAGFKSSDTKKINHLRATPGQPVWQRNYYEHVIRNEIDLEEIEEYIQNNHLKWLEDENHPANIPK